MSPKNRSAHRDKTKFTAGVIVPLQRREMTTPGLVRPIHGTSQETT